MNKSIKTAIALVISGGVLALPSLVYAQTPPDAGSLLRDIESQRLDIAPPIRFGSELPPPLPDTGETITLVGLVFQGHEGLVSEAELQSLLADAIGRNLGFNGLMFLADRVTEYVKNKGYFLAFAYLPEQDISDGVLLITIQPGRIEGGGDWQHLLDNKTVNLTDRRIVNTLNNALKADTSGIIQANQMERGLLLFNDLAGISARSDLQAGSEPGTTRVNVIFNDTDRYTGLAWVDNYGNFYTGTNRINLMANVNNLSGMGDQFNAMVSITSGLTYGRLGYQAPLGYSGLTINPYVSHLNYKLGEDFANQDLTGQATTYGADLRYPIIRSRTANVNAIAGLEYKKLEDDTVENITGKRDFNRAHLRLQGNHTNTKARGGFTQYQMTVQYGDVKNSLNANKTETFGYVMANISRLQNISSQWNVFVSAETQQMPSRNLDSSEKFSIGGISGVRAYPSGEAAGDSGYKLTAEARYDFSGPQGLGGDWQLQVFVDHGVVLRNKETTSPFDTLPNRNELTGAGLGMSWSKPNAYSVRATYAHKINDNPFQRRSSGLDSEAKNDNGRFWLQAMVWF
ncbi:ShlB/FhaC/HecB family hemolysin secretion/activation protein [Thiomicrospira cyclica]|uniref:Polypeptide-transport-associated domain protein ShlB-type n=1 Tax=Thiomicrospira cyclica (strain DSM 14477 / JCM 11371 / ALM1) TaxID=717773 RepID=F6DA73_THICA|nr:ShlB/FhaC/HecB family hemolysin secretion/activation protein [Thiomicrospira cyclica]AEG32204.1 Polypeptide-transport-associated domain protein ShlB-type [Thiomicrospira cyclica ALM1]